jgi:hypothetical protein
VLSEAVVQTQVLVIERTDLLSFQLLNPLVRILPLSPVRGTYIDAPASTCIDVSHAKPAAWKMEYERTISTYDRELKIAVERCARCWLPPSLGSITVGQQKAFKPLRELIILSQFIPETLLT